MWLRRNVAVLLAAPLSLSLRRRQGQRRRMTRTKRQRGSCSRVWGWDAGIELERRGEGGSKGESKEGSKGESKGGRWDWRGHGHGHECEPYHGRQPGRRGLGAGRGCEELRAQRRLVRRMRRWGQCARVALEGGRRRENGNRLHRGCRSNRASGCGAGEATLGISLMPVLT